MTCRAVVAQRTLGISVKGLFHVPKMKEVGAWVERNVLKDQNTHSLCFLLVNKLSNIWCYKRMWNTTPFSPTTHTKITSDEMLHSYDY